MPNNTLHELLEKVSSELTPEESSVAQSYVATLEAAGIATPSELLDVLGDPKRNVSTRCMGCRIAAWLQIGAAMPALVHVVTVEEDDGLVWEAASAIVKLETQTTAMLLRVLEESKALNQAAAAWVLGWLRAPAAIPSLRRIAVDAQRPTDVRAHAIEAIGVMRANEALPDLVATLFDETPELRYWAAYALGEVGDEDCIPHLQQLIMAGDAQLPDGRSVKEEALEAVAAIRERLERPS